jgi:hypothetical protein
MMIFCSDALARWASGVRLRPTDTFDVVPFAGDARCSRPCPGRPHRRTSSAPSRSSTPSAAAAAPSSSVRCARRWRCRPIRTARTLLVIADGEVAAEEEAFELIRASQGAANVFTFGIGRARGRATATC